jgi:hypothetical protein
MGSFRSTLICVWRVVKGSFGVPGGAKAMPVAILWVGLPSKDCALIK